MKNNVPWIITALSLVSNASYAVNPVNGWYGGVMLGASATPSTFFTFTTPISEIQGTGSLTYSVLGNVGGELGYRCNRFRFELQGDYDNNPYESLTIGNYLLTSSTSTTTFSMQGNLQVASVMFNVYYDFNNAFKSDNYGETYWIPYIGIGGGGAYVQNNIQIDYNQVEYGSQSGNVSGAAAQAIAGVNYFLDDFTSFGFDARYFTTFAKSRYLGTKTEIFSINVMFNGVFSGA